MRISKLSITNHQRVPDFEIEVRDHAVFVGPNAVGKSTVLRLLDLLLGATWSQLHAALDITQLRDTTKPLIVEVRLDDLDADDKAHFADKAEVGAGPAAGTIWLTARLTVEVSRIEPDRLDIERRFVKPSFDHFPVNRDDLSQIGWSYLPANRSPDRDLGRGRRSVLRSLLSALTLQDDEERAIQTVLSSLRNTLGTSQTLGQLRTDLAASLSRLFPYSVTKDDIHVDLPSSTEDPLSDLDILISRDGSRDLLNAQSDGLRTLSVVAASLLTKPFGRLLAIDEPEIHLHPRGQSNLATLLANSPGQRLIATHAPTVLACFLPEHAIVLSPGGARQLSGTTFENNPKHFQHWWIESALEPLTANMAVFVEGVSDRIIVTAVARLLSIGLDRLGISVVAIGGAGNFIPALKLFGPIGFQLPFLGLVDENEASIPASALGVGVKDLVNHNILTCHEDLEYEYVSDLGVTDTLDLLVKSGLFSKAQILATVGVQTPHLISPHDLATFVRKHKVEAATAISEGLSKSQAGRLTTVVQLLKRAVDR